MFSHGSFSSYGNMPHTQARKLIMLIIVVVLQEPRKRICKRMA
jgi:hypothetical protein